MSDATLTTCYMCGCECEGRKCPVCGEDFDGPLLGLLTAPEPTADDDDSPLELT